MKATRKNLLNLVKELNGAPYDPGDNGDKALLFLITAGVAGTTNYTKISQLSGLSLQECARFGRSARGKRPKSDNPIFVGHSINAEWGDPETGGLALIGDSLCLNGLLKRVAVDATP